MHSSNFLVINCVWFGYWCSFTKYKSAVGYEKSTRRYITTDSEGFRYAVFAPSYLRFTGNLSLGNAIWGEDEDSNFTTLIIWPKFLGGYDFGVSIYIPESSDDPNEYTYGTLQIMIDEDGNPVTDELTDDEMELFEKNEDMVRNVLQKAYNMWGIGTDNQPEIN